MEHRLDIVAVGITDECAEVTRVVLGPQPRRVQRLGAQLQRCVVEGLHSVGVGGLERHMDFPVGPAGFAGAGVGNPEVRLAFTAVADRNLIVHLPAVPEHAQHGIVELLRFGPVGAVDSKVIDHRSILALGTDMSAPVPRSAVAS